MSIDKLFLDKFDVNNFIMRFKIGTSTIIKKSIAEFSYFS